MAQLLRFTRDNTHTDPVINVQGCYKIGDVIVVSDDSHVFSPAEQVSPFEVVHLAGTKAQYQYLTVSDDQIKLPKSALKINIVRSLAIKNADRQTNRRRRYRYTTTIESKNHA